MTDKVIAMCQLLSFKAQKYHCCTEAKVINGTSLKNIVNEFNRALVFDPTKPMMAYSVRDPLAAG